MKRRIRGFVFAATAGLALVGRLVGQTPVNEGDRVRLSAPSYRIDTRIGTVRSVSNDRLVFRPEDSTESVEINYRAISQLDRSQGKKPGIVPGVVYGTGAGILIGGILGSTCDGGVSDNCNSRWILRGAAGGLALGVIAGFTILRTDRWVRITLPGRGAGVGLSGTISF
ncbi:MAG: hypothetical protein ACKVZ0_14155 [Gemmatimonadales bacterium]